MGRGSGANSIVSYCLGITDVCPIELNLYFERFLNPARLTPPDFDIDWSWRERDDILDYIFKRFDTERTAFIGTIGTFKYRSTFRELGKVFSLFTFTLHFSLFTLVMKWMNWMLFSTILLLRPCCFFLPHLEGITTLPITTSQT